MAGSWGVCTSRTEATIVLSRVPPVHRRPHHVALREGPPARERGRIVQVSTAAERSDSRKRT